MDMKQKEANRRANQELVSRMSLRTMYPDDQARVLADAAGRGRIQQIETLVAQGVDVNALGTSGATPLYWPIRRGNVAGFRKLLELGADPNVIFEDGTSIMYFAATENNLEFLRLALNHGADPNLVSGGKRTSREHGEIVTRFIGETPLMHAALHNANAVEAIDLLLEAGADINAKTRDGKTPLFFTTNLRFDVTYALLVRGADYTVQVEGSGRYRSYGFIDTLLNTRRTMLPGTEQMRQYEKVVDWLKTQGVEFPE
ncbi:hypothetical protein A9165_10725 [Alishewanella sp. HH-ZS]|nr:hypothetical protein A9165_10725 [Alishewanella sp. HH-ZS]